METATEGHGGETEKRRQTELKERGSQKKIKKNDSRQDMRAVASMVERQTVRINDLAFVRFFMSVLTILDLIIPDPRKQEPKAVLCF